MLLPFFHFSFCYLVSFFPLLSFPFFQRLFCYLGVWLNVCIHIHNACVPSSLLGHKRMLDALELVLPIVVSHQMVVLGNKIKCSRSSFNHSKPLVFVWERARGKGGERERGRDPRTDGRWGQLASCVLPLWVPGKHHYFRIHLVSAVVFHFFLFPLYLICIMLSTFCYLKSIIWG